MKNIKYSVIIPVYNRPNLISRALDSVLEQTYRNFEVIVVDDGSTDGTSDVIKNYSDKRLRYTRQKNAGPAAARNRGVELSRGEYIAFLDSDDWWLKDKLRESEKAIEKEDEYYIYHTQEKWYRNGKILNQKKKHAKPSGYVFESCLKLCCISISTAVVKRILFERIGLFNQSFPACEDYDFWLRASVKHPVCLIDKVLTEKEGGHRGRLSMEPGLDRYRTLSIKSLIDSGVLNDRQKDLAFEHLKIKCKIYAQGCFKRGKTKEGKKYLKLLERCM